MLREQGFEIYEYGPVFAPDPCVLELQYAFVLCPEVAEHFHYPSREFDRLEKLLRPGGWLAIMTSVFGARFWQITAVLTSGLFGDSPLPQGSLSSVSFRYGGGCQAAQTR